MQPQDGLAAFQAALDEHEAASRQAVSWLVSAKDLAARWRELGLSPEDFHPGARDIARAAAAAPAGKPTLLALAEVAGEALAWRAAEIATRDQFIPCPAGVRAYGLRRARLRVDQARATLDRDAILAGDVARELAALEAAGMVPGGCAASRSIFDIQDPGALKTGERLDTAPPKPDWLLTGLLKRGGLALVCGPGGVGKSTLLLILAVCIAAARGLALAWDVAQGGRVLFATFEDDPEEVHSRLYFTARGLDLTIFERERVRDGLYLLPLAGDVRLVTESPHGPVLTPAWGDFCALVRNLGPALAILDPLSRINGADENDPATAQLLTASLEALARETGTAFIVSHHSNKLASGADALPERLKVESVRGSSALVNAVRCVLTCAPLFAKEARAILGDQEAKDGQYFAVKVAKCNHGPSGGEHYFRRGEGGALEMVTRTARAGDLERMEVLKARVVELVGELTEQGQGVTAKAFTDANAAALKDELGGFASKSRIRDAISGAILDGSLVEVARPNAAGRQTSYLNRVTENTGSSTMPAEPADPGRKSLPV